MLEASAAVRRRPAPRTPSAIRRATQVLPGEVNAMSKGLNAKKETRRKPLKTAQEKRLAKRAKKHAPAAPLGTPPRS
ncbi:hypothetical protein IPC353_19100 [Pseudomonas aeruginosa]|uniref:hypothetical protein n=1 Tax=Pseudomonas aeruginosa TaxID=287 RepID=UPI0008FB2F4D|nr:hypothetical protein APA43_33300 [Pseudomonas aeruginosa]OPE15432.1 hypothetical protein APA76_33175 [Pseudomonas aeruginosa]RQC77220.1 hypothetical protein IPC353_19100 [Pseudomonas aeruginosa]HBP5729217.1 hypothetical protein [Pseudomonas aeruginosa]